MSRRTFSQSRRTQTASSPLSAQSSEVRAFLSRWRSWRPESPGALLLAAESKTADEEPLPYQLAPQFLEDLEYWTRTDRKVALKVHKMMKEILRDPFQGTGQPEPLRGNLSGYWSRRVTKPDRLVYGIHKGFVSFIQCRGHYND